MNYVKLTSTKLVSEISVHGSKSYANRALILAAIKTEEITLVNLPDVSDVNNMLNCLKDIGLRIEENNNEVSIVNSFPACEKKTDGPMEVKVGDGGTTARFLIALLALGENTYKVVLDPGLSKRPFAELIVPLQDLGVRASKNDCEVYVQGPISKREKRLNIDCAKSTQFASAISLALVDHNIKLSFLNLELSKKYLLMTNEMIRIFDKRFHIPVDTSSAGYLIAWGLLNQDITLQNFYEIDQYQADSKIFEVMDELDAHYSFSGKGLKVYQLKSKKRGFNVDANDCIDLVPTLCFLASFLDAKSEIKNLKGLIHKESNRLEEMIKIMDLFSVKYFLNSVKDSLIIEGDSQNRKGVGRIDTAYDHRMVMTASLYLKQLGGGEVYPGESVTKSFTNFFEIFN